MLPAPDSLSNPLQYLVTWNPWNVATSGGAGAQYLQDGRIRIVPQSRLFLHTWPVEVDGVGRLEGYPNRDSLSYLEHFGLNGVHTMIRGTLRHPGFCETWSKVVNLGLTNDTIHIPNLGERSPREVVEMFLPIPVPPERVEAAATLFLELNPDRSADGEPPFPRSLRRSNPPGAPVTRPPPCCRTCSRPGWRRCPSRATW